MSLMTKDNEETTIDLLQVLRLLWKKIWLILLCTAVGALIALAITRFAIKPTYRAQITMYVNNRSEEGSTLSSSDLTAAAKLVDTYSAIIRSDTVMSAVITRIGENWTTVTAKQKVSAKAVNNTEVFNVFVEDYDPVRAANMANAIADVSPDIIMDIVTGSSAKIIDRATVPTGRYSPSYRRNVLLGALAGFVLISAVILIRGFMDDSIAGPEDLENMGYSLLAVIPDLNEASDSSYGYGYGKGYGSYGATAAARKKAAEASDTTTQ